MGASIAPPLPQLGTKGNSGIIKGGCAEHKLRARSRLRLYLVLLLLLLVLFLILLFIFLFLLCASRLSTCQSKLDRPVVCRMKNRPIVPVDVPLQDSYLTTGDSHSRGGSSEDRNSEAHSPPSRPRKKVRRRLAGAQLQDRVPRRGRRVLR